MSTELKEKEIFEDERNENNFRSGGKDKFIRALKGKVSFLRSGNPENFPIKLYDENVQLLASSSKSSYSIEKCKQQIKETTIQQPGRPQTQITEKLPDKCVTLEPSILDKDIKQATSILFASIHPVK